MTTASTKTLTGAAGPDGRRCAGFFRLGHYYLREHLPPVDFLKSLHEMKG